MVTYRKGCFVHFKMIRDSSVTTDEPRLSKKALDAIQAKRAEQKSEMAKSSGLTSSPGYTG
ncbi:hypothetical protein, partial [Escherichia coli]|uniref:hypothetical protein n=1 Tax=Escherichia coli TaxID=562 RepID=UPI003EE3FC8C